MYIENEALINLYVRPFPEGRSELTEELNYDVYGNYVISHTRGNCQLCGRFPP